MNPIIQNRLEKNKGAEEKEKKRMNKIKKENEKNNEMW